MKSIIFLISFSNFIVSFVDGGNSCKCYQAPTTVEGSEGVVDEGDNNRLGGAEIDETETFVLENVLSYDQDYRKEVLVANAFIELAYNKNDLIVGNNSGINGLEHVIKLMVEDFVHYDEFVIMNLMIAVPDKTDLLTLMHYSGHDDNKTRLKNYQKDMGLKISTVLGLSDTEIEEIKRLGDFEIGETERLGDLEIDETERLGGSEIVETERLGDLEIEETERHGDSEFDETERLGDTEIDDAENIETIAQTRRDCTGPAIKNIIRRVLDEPTPAVPDNPALKLMCRMLGILRSTQFPTEYITMVKMDYSKHICILLHNTTPYSYTIRRGVWGQLMRNNLFQPLVEQLE
ncbi:uncharacterized protein LOC126841251 isoform X7 [Adelges cooleyi]|uniref:uncharacterized protein LOC126841251 isoform X1 n=1 Tax=Adelges cooleyi TaxID=133065 RepID=UPI00218050DA|nr:uncharacterized protein LOC126841251 isoform X1 [Adelges cooleyi]XP_050433551.1 uncharacterized protein LOC126841251 isoform X2 [Adelges cooleyi]XP_050433552.1 uncharacterized protein LOC126841251 isoform X3 [Adelges cooleyi]XP_050433553.1 uncharacterized protein LOC126841251 isoform X4 [Adelges cooleyi]XP_050433554.1 uncharacterized protein LOC126841251 isoform X5 [Adelges cooleyi]XP_050433555.1 uncharacterized protein LOC126841251 isoform X6 [Adelges cooleyi]XP_050433556.1 uncharacterize